MEIKILIDLITAEANKKLAIFADVMKKPSTEENYQIAIDTFKGYASEMNTLKKLSELLQKFDEAEKQEENKESNEFKGAPV